LVQLLLASHANVNARDKQGETALMWAAYHGHKDVVELLLANKADASIKNSTGETALSGAILGKHQDIAELLRQHGSQ
jgi:ankyrin repeat protein